MIGIRDDTTTTMTTAFPLLELPREPLAGVLDALERPLDWLNVMLSCRYLFSVVSPSQKRRRYDALHFLGLRRFDPERLPRDATVQIVAENGAGKTNALRTLIAALGCGEHWRIRSDPDEDLDTDPDTDPDTDSDSDADSDSPIASGWPPTDHVVSNAREWAIQHALQCGEQPVTCRSVYAVKKSQCGKSLTCRSVYAIDDMDKLSSHAQAKEARIAGRAFVFRLYTRAYFFMADALWQSTAWLPYADPHLDARCLWIVQPLPHVIDMLHGRRYTTRKLTGS
ncbi:Hypothetical protein UVM_LOCUS189 [uncultured virus]|nr:Hypothetical protein UVM_LOCUS189 [uncultured virus]